MNKYDLLNILTAVGLLSWAAAALIPLFWELWRLARSHRMHRHRQLEVALERFNTAYLASEIAPERARRAASIRRR